MSKTFVWKKGKICVQITFNAEKTSPVDWEIPPTITISFSAVMLAIRDPYLDSGEMEQYDGIIASHLVSPMSGPICQLSTSRNPISIQGDSRRLSGIRKNSEVEDQRLPAITTIVEFSPAEF